MSNNSESDTCPEKAIIPPPYHEDNSSDLVFGLESDSGDSSDSSSSGSSSSTIDVKEHSDAQLDRIAASVVLEQRGEAISSDDEEEDSMGQENIQDDVKDKEVTQPVVDQSSSTEIKSSDNSWSKRGSAKSSDSAVDSTTSKDTTHVQDDGKEREENMHNAKEEEELEEGELRDDDVDDGIEGICLPEDEDDIEEITEEPVFEPTDSLVESNRFYGYYPNQFNFYNRPPPPAFVMTHPMMANAAMAHSIAGGAMMSASHMGAMPPPPYAMIPIGGEHNTHRSPAVCRFFLRGACSWGDNCKYAHPAGAAPPPATVFSHRHLPQHPPSNVSHIGDNNGSRVNDSDESTQQAQHSHRHLTQRDSPLISSAGEDRTNNGGTTTRAAANTHPTTQISVVSRGASQSPSRADKTQRISSASDDRPILDDAYRSAERAALMRRRNARGTRYRRSSRSRSGSSTYSSSSSASSRSRSSRSKSSSSSSSSSTSRSSCSTARRLELLRRSSATLLMNERFSVASPVPVQYSSAYYQRESLERGLKSKHKKERREEDQSRRKRRSRSPDSRDRYWNERDRRTSTRSSHSSSGGGLPAMKGTLDSKHTTRIDRVDYRRERWSKNRHRDASSTEEETRKRARKNEDRDAVLRDRGCGRRDDFRRINSRRSRSASLSSSPAFKSKSDAIEICTPQKAALHASPLVEPISSDSESADEEVEKATAKTKNTDERFVLST